VAESQEPKLTLRRLTSLVLLVPGAILAGAWTILQIEYPGEWPYGLLAGWLALLFAVLTAWRQQGRYAFGVTGACALSLFDLFILVWCGDYIRGCETAYALMWPILWASALGGGGAVLVGIALAVSGPHPAPPTGGPACRNCGAALYEQWWSDADGGYKCRRCGEINPRAEAVAPGA
jgi:hypothetical protein